MTQRLILLLALIWGIALIAMDRFLLDRSLSVRFWIVTAGLSLAVLSFSSVAKQPMVWLIVSSLLALVGLRRTVDRNIPKFVIRLECEESRGGLELY